MGPDLREILSSTKLEILASADASEAAGLIERTISSLAYYNDRARYAEIAKYRAPLLRDLLKDDPQSVIVAKSAATIIGFCISNFDDETIWLAWFGVDAPHRGRGIGTLLIERLESTAVERGAHKIWCDTRTDNVASQRVLEAMGFSQICTIRRHWYRQDFLLWEKVLC